MKTEVLLIHGFTGDSSTWGGFPGLLNADTELRASHRFAVWEYPTRLDLSYSIFKYFWKDDPDITTLGDALRARLSVLPGDCERIVLIGHSMGGLVIQAFILEELINNRGQYLDRMTEVMLMGTPSAGLKKAAFGAFIKNQVADMSHIGPFIEKLRDGWRQNIDNLRISGECPVPFRLSLFAGLQDNFVPRTSSLEPFPLDEQVLVPGDHVSMVKPTKAADLVYELVRQRLLRKTLTAAERALISGESLKVGQYLAKIKSARMLEDIDELLSIARELLGAEVRAPLVERELGLRLLGLERYQEASELLGRYLAFCMPTGEQPFAGDAQAIQQQAIALSGAGRLTEAVEVLNSLPQVIQDDPETLGILGGRFKRGWLKDENNIRVGRRALRCYEQALENAEPNIHDQIIYNAINAGYLGFALGENGFEDRVRRVLKAYDEGGLKADYWAEASRAEAYLLLRQYANAEEAYQAARRCEHESRYWATTGQQALDIIRRQGSPQEADAVKALFAY